jgi:hypothetical protein
MIHNLMDIDLLQHISFTIFKYFCKFLDVRHFSFSVFKYELDPILRFLNVQLQRQRCSRLESFKSEKNYFYLKTRHAINSAVNFYNAGVVTR